jgi:hypothetical protein
MPTCRHSVQPATAERRDIPIEQFTYDPAADCFTCPTGKLLARIGASNVGTVTGGVIYGARPEECTGCPLKERCCPTAHARTLFRANDQGVRERVVRYLATA